TNGTKLFSNLINGPNAPFYPELSGVPVIPPQGGFPQGTPISQLTSNLPGHNGAWQPTYDELLRYRLIWDVDNDGDGIPDSIWIDPGLPVITTPDGRRIKRLAAILIKDLDGSVNVNAHGNMMQVVNKRGPNTDLSGVRYYNYRAEQAVYAGRPDN